MFIGCVGAAAHGSLLPLMILVFGNLLNGFTSRVSDLCKMNFTEIALTSCIPGYDLNINNYYMSFE